MLNWMLGKFISFKRRQSVWGDKTIEQLSAFIKSEKPGIRGFEKRSLERMRRFYELWTTGVDEVILPQKSQLSSFPLIASTVLTQLQGVENKGDEFASTVLTQIEKEKQLLSALCKISWSHHLELITQTAGPEERIYYLWLAIEQKLTVRELRRQIESAAFERQVLSDNNKIIHPEAARIRQLFKDTYITEFLDLPELYSEKDLQQAVVAQMKNFILELGHDFLFMGHGFKLQVGMKDYFLDLLFYHRELHCMVVFELKIEEFKPEHLGKLNFYLEALDRNVKKELENPSIGILLCKTKDSEVVEYALSRNVSPAMIAQYQTKLPDKKLLQQKMQELLENSPRKASGH